MAESPGARTPPDVPAVAVTPLRIVIADDHTLLRHGIRALLQEAGGFDVVAEASDGRQAVQLAVRHAPDILLLDVEMPGYSVLETLRQLKRLQRPAGPTVPAAPDSPVGLTGPRILLLGTHATEEALFQYLSAGAAGLLLKEASAAELLRALHDVQRANFYVSSSVSKKVLDRWHRGLVRPPRRRSARVEAPGGAALSERERQVLEHVAGGLANREIAERLSISVKTVEAHKAHMISRLGLRGAAELVRFAVQQRLATSSPAAPAAAVNAVNQVQT